LFEEDPLGLRVEQVRPVRLDLEVEELDGAVADVLAAGLDLREQPDQGAWKEGLTRLGTRVARFFLVQHTKTGKIT
jgi:hypothetical protein